MDGLPRVPQLEAKDGSARTHALSLDYDGKNHLPNPSLLLPHHGPHVNNYKMNNKAHWDSKPALTGSSMLRTAADILSIAMLTPMAVGTGPRACGPLK